MVSLQDTTYRAPPIPHVTVQSLASTSPHGVPTRKLTRVIQGTPTDVCIQEYLDRTFVIVTQVGKLGVVVSHVLTKLMYQAVEADMLTLLDFDAVPMFLRLFSPVRHKPLYRPTRLSAQLRQTMARALTISRTLTTKAVLLSQIHFHFHPT